MATSLGVPALAGFFRGDSRYSREKRSAIFAIPGIRCIDATLDNLWYNNLPVALTGARYLTTLKTLGHASQMFTSVYSHFYPQKQACPNEVAPRDTGAAPNPLQINSLRFPSSCGTRKALCLQRFTAIFAPKNRPVPPKISLRDTA
jgi:hypothetical protein